MIWITDEPTIKEINVELESHGDRGFYLILAERRPTYCDRGDWVIKIWPMGVGTITLDEQDGFPRYFFGDEQAVKSQIETWISRRSETVKK